MKKVLAIVLAAVMILSCSMTAFAEFTVNGQTYQTPPQSDDRNIAGVGYYSYHDNDSYTSVDITVTVEPPKTVSENQAKEYLSVNSSVVGDSGNSPSVKATTENYDTSTHATSHIFVYGDVYASGSANAVEAGSQGVIDICGDKTIKGDGDVIENGTGHAIVAKAGSEVTVEGNVKEEGDGVAINASDNGTQVTVYGDVIEKGEGGGSSDRIERSSKSWWQCKK